MNLAKDSAQNYYRNETKSCALTRELSSTAIKKTWRKRSKRRFSLVHPAAYQDLSRREKLHPMTVPRNALLGHGVRNRWSPHPSLSLSSIQPSVPSALPCRASTQRRRENIRFLAAPCNTRLVPKIRAPSRPFTTLDSVEAERLVNAKTTLEGHPPVWSNTLLN